ncbi:MAG: response regulator [bacterium]
MALKILVAEDDRHTRRILDHIFTKDPAFRDQEVQLFLAPDGEEALKLFEQESPDLVISDLLMPRLDGFALCRAIRRLPAGKDVPVIVTSAIYKETALLNRMRDELGVEFFAKPFQVRELVRGVQRLLEKRLRPGRASSPPPPPMRQPTGEITRLRGELSSRPLASLIFDLLEEQTTGILTLQRGRVKKEIYVILGHPVGAESNIRTESLGHYLVAKRVIDEQQHQRAVATAKEKRLSLMEALVQLDWLSETDVFRHHTALVKLKIINSLRWHDGNYAFAPGDSFSQRIPKVTIDVANILLLGLQRVTNLDEVSKKLDEVANKALRLTARAEHYRDIFTKVFGDEVLRILPGHPSLNEMLSKGTEALKVYLQTNALLECGMCELGEDKDTAGAAAPIPAEDPIGLRQLKQEATRSPDIGAADSREGLLYEEIFGVDEISVVTAMPVPEPLDSGIELVDSGELAIDIQLEDGTELFEPGMSTSEARKLVVTTYLGIHDKSYYEILGVPSTAPPPLIRDAYERLAQTFMVENFTDCDLGLDHPKLEEINHLLRQTYEALSDPVRRAEYDESRRREEAVHQVDPAEAEAHFQTGLLELRRGMSEAAVAAFRQALEIDPDSPDYHAYLAWATYSASPDNPQAHRDAIEHLEQALMLNPDELQAHLFYGKICIGIDRIAEGREHLERALDLDPANREVFDELAVVHTTNGDWKLLERQHRKVLHRLGNRLPERVVAVWKSLAVVYRDRLNDLDSARTSLEVALSVVPNDPELSAALQELQRPDPKLWRDTAESLKGQLTGAPSDAPTLQQLLTLYRGVDQHDAAFLVASLLAHHGARADDSDALYTRFKPRFLIRARRNVDAEIWQKIVHPEDDPKTSQLFEALALLKADFDFELGDPPTLGDPVSAADQPADFARVLQYLCGLLALPEPTVHVRRGADAQAALHRPIAPVLAVDEELFGSTDRLRIATQLSRLIPYFWAGRAFGITMRTKQLRNVLMGAMKLVAPKLKVDDPDGKIERIRQRLSEAPPEVCTQLAEVIHSLTKERSSLNITRWMKGMARSADRFAVVVIGDLHTALSYLPAQQPPEVLADLQSYILSAEHLELRELIATSIAV